MSITEFNSFTNWIINESKTKKIEDNIIKIWKVLFEQNKSLLTEYKLYNLPCKNNPSVILTMTSCKRLNLFQQTVNSIINNWTDLPMVDQFIVIDDNSSVEDRVTMVEDYKFIKFIMKSLNQKGHLQSMNLIYDILKKEIPTYWIHIEDDFLFFVSMPYVTLGIQGLSELYHFNVRQIMFNRNYAETFEQINMTGHIPYLDNMYSFHNYKPGGNQCQYWPHFSFRPSIIDVEAILSLGDFTSDRTFFENDYAQKWTKNGNKTGFFNTITNIHIGRICNTEGENAYTLNNVAQFDNQKINKDFNIKVINLASRKDRLFDITDQLQKENLLFERIEAVDGKQLTLTHEIRELFKGNDFGFKRGVVGCALSHYYLWKRLINSKDKYYVIIEDDALLTNNFSQKLSYTINQILEHNIDLLFGGYHMSVKDREKYKDIYDINSDTTTIELIKYPLYIGGTHCYIITKEGASALIDFISINGIKHGIDYLMVKVQKIIDIYETIPHIAFAEWVTDVKNSLVDSDIQYDNQPVPYNLNNKYIFIEGLDEIGNDCFVADKSINKDGYRDIASSMKECIAYNTMGFFKNKLTKLVKSPYFGPKDGIYVNENYYFNVFKKKG